MGGSDAAAQAPARAGSVWSVVLIGLAAIAGWTVGGLAAGDAPVLALLAPALLLPVALWLQLRLAVYLLFGAAVVIEQFAYAVGPRDGAVTANVPAFQGVVGPLNLVELLIGLALVIAVMQAVQRKAKMPDRTPLTVSLLAVMAVVITYFLYGVLGGGDVVKALWELRPFLYLASCYFLASALIRSYAAFRPLLWIVVLGSGLKAIYGLFIFMSVRDVQPRPEAVLAHEESFLFGVFIIATAALWVFGVKDRIRTVATLLLPAVLLCDMVNSRRTAWLILISSLALLYLIALVRLPARRRQLGVLGVVAALGTAIYLPLFWNKTSTIAQPARAVRSAIAPDQRDEMSNQYREIETYNLQVFIKGSRSLGTGFGHRLHYFGLVDLTVENPMLAYVPHNGILYIWLRTGIGGMVVVGIFLIQAAVSAVRLSAAKQPQLAAVGAIAAGALVGYVAMAVTDMGFFWFRNAIVMGVLLGVVDGISRALRQSSQPELEQVDARGVVAELEPA